MNRRRAWTFVALLGIWTAGLGDAQAGSVCPQRPADDTEAKELASTWFSLGEQLVKHSAYSEAVAAFECSLSMMSHPATLYNAGQAALLAGDPRKALAFFELYLARAKPYDELTTDVEERARVLRAELGQENDLLIAGPSSTARDGADPAALLAGQDPDTLAPTDTAASASKPVNLKPLELTSFVAGATLVGLGVALHITAAVKREDGRDAGTWTEFREAEHGMKVAQGWAIACYVLGAAALGTGVVLHVRHKKRGAKALSLGPAPLGLTASLAF